MQVISLKLLLEPVKTCFHEQFSSVSSYFYTSIYMHRKLEALPWM